MTRAGRRKERKSAAAATTPLAPAPTTAMVGFDTKVTSDSGPIPRRRPGRRLAAEHPERREHEQDPDHELNDRIPRIERHTGILQHGRAVLHDRPRAVSEAEEFG